MRSLPATTAEASSTAHPSQIDLRDFLFHRDTVAVTRSLLAVDPSGLRDLLQDGLANRSGDQAAKICCGIALGLGEAKHGERATWLALIDAATKCISSDALPRALKVFCDQADGAGCPADVWGALLTACCGAPTQQE